jgi:predicted nucleic acid-binding protein
VYLVDTDIISELRKKDKANLGVTSFFRDALVRDLPLYLAAVTVGELRRGVEMIRHRGDLRQARSLERWLDGVVAEYGENILPFDADAAQIWGRLRVPHPENPLDKQIAATALLYDVVLVTHNVRHFSSTPVRLLDPFV